MFCWLSCHTLEFFCCTQFSLWLLLFSFTLVVFNSTSLDIVKFFFRLKKVFGLNDFSLYFLDLLALIWAVRGSHNFYAFLQIAQNAKYLRVEFIVQFFMTTIVFEFSLNGVLCVSGLVFRKYNIVIDNLLKSGFSKFFPFS